MHIYAHHSFPRGCKRYITQRREGIWDLYFFKFLTQCFLWVFGVPNAIGKDAKKVRVVALGIKKLQDLIRKTRCVNFTNDMLHPRVSQTLMCT